MRYYCESNPQTINHVTPSVLMLDTKIQQDNHIAKGTTLLDLGCGNGRNSLYLAKKYNATNVVLVDSDVTMLNWAQQLFSVEGLYTKTVCTTVEELAGDHARLNDKIGIDPFDIVLFSYVVQHIDPVYYPLIFDLCKDISKKYLAIDVFWNPSRLSPGEFTKIGSVNWYGLTYEELVGIVAPRFLILNRRIHQTDISFMVNMLVTEGQTLLKNVFDRNYEYNSNRIRLHRSSKFRASTGSDR